MSDEITKTNESKRYYWMRLREDFFDEEAIDYLEEQENGSTYTLFYLKLCLKSIKREGILVRSIGDVFVPYTYDKLSTMTKTPLDTVVVAMELLKRIGLVRESEDGFLEVPQVRELIGSEAANDHAQRQKRYRERKKLEQLNKIAEEKLKLISDSVTNSDAISDNVTSLECHKPVTRERDKRLDIYIDKKSASADATPPPKKSKTHYAEKVMMTEEEHEKLVEQFGENETKVWIERLDDYKASTGKKYKDDYRTILNWYKRDNKNNQQVQVRNHKKIDDTEIIKYEDVI